MQGIISALQVNVKGWGDDTEPLWKYLKDNSPNCKITKEVWWNFEKVLVDKEGQVVNSCYVPLPSLSPLLTRFV
jgi:glutathione peroxidase-family protein